MAVPNDIASDKPDCPDHGATMIYDPETAYWTCPNFQCGKKARRRKTIGDAEGVVLAGDLHLYSVGEGQNEKFYLYVRQLGAFLDLNSVVSMDTTGDVHGKSTEFHLGLLFPQLRRGDDQKKAAV